MAGTPPVTTLDPDYSDESATATPWTDARDQLAAAGIYWLSTVRPDGRPHVTPLLAVWLDTPAGDGAVYFCTGPEERKARNLAHNPQVVLTTGSNALHDGVDLVVEGEAVPVHDEALLRRAADAWVAKYGEFWRFGVGDGNFRHPQGGGPVLVFQVAPRVAFGFGKGRSFGSGGYGQTRWRFEP
jgi:nitroimidazol reductase NimA-like FMN-containing flavoprotein (pyridoxamine 5'-phosphate oxidase superfamily)